MGDLLANAIGCSRLAPNSLAAVDSFPHPGDCGRGAPGLYSRVIVSSFSVIKRGQESLKTVAILLPPIGAPRAPKALKLFPCLLIRGGSNHRHRLPQTAKVADGNALKNRKSMKGIDSR